MRTRSDNDEEQIMIMMIMCKGHSRRRVDSYIQHLWTQHVWYTDMKHHALYYCRRRHDDAALGAAGTTRSIWYRNLRGSTSLMSPVAAYGCAASHLMLTVAGTGYFMLALCAALLCTCTGVTWSGPACMMQAAPRDGPLRSTILVDPETGHLAWTSQNKP